MNRLRSGYVIITYDKDITRSGMRIKEPTEKQICIAFYKQFRQLQNLNYFKKPLIVFHVVNEQFNASFAYTNSLLNMGLVPGVADYGILYPPGKIAFIEFKRNAKCKQRPCQVEFQEQCERLGIPYTIQWTADGAIEWVDGL